MLATNVFRTATFALVSLVVWPAAHILAQVNATGTFSGQVTDPGGAAVPNAAVKATEQNTGVSISRATAGDGYYTIPLLKPGAYTIEVSATGFSTAVVKDLTLQVQQVVQQDFKLQVGAIQQQVNVEGTAPLLNTETVEVGNVITQTSIEQLPLNGRNFSQLALLVPGTTPGPVGGIRQTGGGNETKRDGAEITTSGARGSFNMFMVDGLDDRDQVVGTIKIFPNLEAIGEFKIQVANTDAQFATGGAVVNVISRSGSNSIHGSAFEFLRNQLFDARGFFDGVKPPFQQNQFGGSIGGPIQKNKTFFFADYQGQRVHTSATSINSEPTAAMIAGNFAGVATIYDPNTYNASTNTRQPFANNQVPTSRFDKVGVNLLQVFPLPNLPGLVNNLRLNNLSVQTQDAWDGRVDHVFSEKDSIFGRYTYAGADLTLPHDLPVEKNGVLNPIAFVGTGQRVNHAPSTQGTIQEIHSFTPALVNQVAVGYTRWFLDVEPIDLGNYTSQKLGLLGSNTAGYASGLANLNFSGGYTGTGNSNSVPEIVPQNTYQLSDTISYTHGKHSMKFGGSVIHNAFGFLQVGGLPGGLSFSGTYTNTPAGTAGTGSAWADFLLGLPSSSSKASLPGGVPYLSYTEEGLFWQDQWRASRKLTVNVGVRWDLFTWPTERYNRQSNFVPGPGTLAIAGQNGNSRSLLDVHHDEFSPRIGLAYRLGDKSVIRTGYGLYFFNEQGTGGSARLFINYPFVQSLSQTCTNVTPCLQTSNGIAAALNPANTPSVVYIPTKAQNSSMQQWNFSAERQVTNAMVVRGSYVGSRGNHLYIAIDEDVPTPGPGAIQARRPYQQYSGISSWEPVGISTYHALQLSAERRFSSGLMFNASYTWSRCLDMGGGGNSASAEGRLNVQDQHNLRSDYGLCDFNYSHRVTLNGVYDLPFGRGRQMLGNAGGVLNAVVGGWQADSIFQAQTGPPGTLSVSTSTANTGNTQYPNRVCDGNDGPKTVSMWFKTSCYTIPALYTWGNAGRNVVIAPGLWIWDAGVHKDFRLTEKTGLTFRSEFFNFLNKANFGYPNRTIGGATAGTITAAGPGRQIQFALRLHW
jgi:hypothetical protein